MYLNLASNMLVFRYMMTYFHQGMPNSGWPCMLGLSLQPYSAVILLRQS